jgi:hypothetical protein
MSPMIGGLGRESRAFGGVPANAASPKRRAKKGGFSAPKGSGLTDEA